LLPFEQLREQAKKFSFCGAVCPHGVDGKGRPIACTQSFGHDQGHHSPVGIVLHEAYKSEQGIRI
jgi:hypothetical protein